MSLSISKYRYWYFQECPDQYRYRYKNYLIDTNINTDIFKKCKYIDNWYGFRYTKHSYADIQLPIFRSFPFCKKCNQMQSLKATKAQREVFRDGHFAAALSKLFSKWLNILISWKHNFQF